MGELTDVLLKALAAEGQRALRANERPGIPAAIQPDLDQLALGSGSGLLFGLCLLGRRLLWLEAVFPDWAVETLIPVLLWQRGEERRLAAWSGLLWQAALSRVLSRHIEEGYLQTVRRREQLAEEDRDGLLRHWAGLVWYRSASLEASSTSKRPANS